MRRKLNVNAAWAAATQAFRANAWQLICAGLLAGLLSICTFFIGAPAMVVGLRRLQLRAIRGEQVRANELMDGWKLLGPAWLLMLLTMLVGGIIGLPGQLLNLLGSATSAHQVQLLALIVQGVTAIVSGLVGVAFTWGNYLMADGDRDAVSCLSQSARTTFPNYVTVLGFTFLTGLLAFSGMLLLGVGMIVTIPLAELLFAHGYTQFFGGREQVVETE